MSWLSPLRELFSRRADTETARVSRIALPAFPELRKPSHLPRFSAIANESDATRPEDLSESARLNLAFAPAQPISDLRRFAGRTEMIGRLIRTIEDRRMHLVVHGDRGMGKTSILHILAILAQEARYLVRYVSCSEDSNFDQTFRAVAADIPLLFHDEFDPTSAETERGSTLADVLGDRPLTPASVSEAFGKLTGTRLLVMLDEYDRVASPQFRLAVAELIKNLSDRSARAQLVLGGVAANLNELVEHIPSIRRNVLGVAVGAMNQEELSQILSNAEAIAGMRFAGEARGLLIDAASGSPFLANLLGQQSCRNALARGRTDVHREDVRGAIGIVIDEMRSRLPASAAQQLSVLEEYLAPELQRQVGNIAQGNFGKLDSHLESRIRESLDGANRPEWWTEAGQFLLYDDSQALILSLKASLERSMISAAP